MKEMIVHRLRWLCYNFFMFTDRWFHLFFFFGKRAEEIFIKRLSWEDFHVSIFAKLLRFCKNNRFRGNMIGDEVEHKDIVSRF